MYIYIYIGSYCIEFFYLNNNTKQEKKKIPANFVYNKYIHFFFIFHNTLRLDFIFTHVFSVYRI